MFIRFLIFVLFFYVKVSGQSFIDNNDWSYHNNLKDVESAAFYDNKIFCFNKSGYFLLVGRTTLMVMTEIRKLYFLF